MQDSCGMSLLLLCLLCTGSSYMAIAPTEKVWLVKSPSELLLRLLYRIPRCFLIEGEGNFAVNNDHNFSQMYLHSIIGIYIYLFIYHIYIYNRKKSTDFRIICLPACEYRRVCKKVWSPGWIIFRYRNLIQHKKHPLNQLKAKHQWRRGTPTCQHGGNQEPFEVKVSYTHPKIFSGVDNQKLEAWRTFARLIAADPTSYTVVVYAY